MGSSLLAQVLENTVYSFAAALAVYLLGIFAGAANRRSNRLKLYNNAMLAMLVFSVTLGAVLLRTTPWLFTAFEHIGKGSLPVMVFSELTISLFV